MRNKKLIVCIIIVFVLIVLLTPIRKNLNDGGSVMYKSLIYEITKIHQLAGIEGVKPYIDGYEIKIFGIIVYRKTNIDEIEQIKNEDIDSNLNNKVTTISIQETGLSSVAPAKEYTLNQEEIYTIFSIVDNLTFSNETCDGLPTYYIQYNSEEKENFLTYGIEIFEDEYHITSDSNGEAILSNEQREKIDEIIKKIDN